MIKRIGNVDMKKCVGLTASITIFLGAGIASADILHMQDGQKQVGVIVKAKTNPSQVTIRTTSGEITIPRTKVSRIEEQSAAQSYGALGDAYVQSGNFDKAIESYETGLKSDPGNVDLQQKLQQARGGVSTKTAATQAALDDKTRRVVDQAMQMARGGNFDQAYSTLKSVEPSEFSPIYAQYRQSMADLYLMWGQTLLDRQDTGGAADKLNQVLKLDPSNATAKQLLIKTFEGDPTKLEETAKFYLQSESGEEQLKGADALYKLQRYEEAAQVYMKYMSDPTLNSRFNITQRLQTLLDTLHQQYASRGDYRKALEYFQQYIQVKPDADPMPYSKYMYMIKRAETDMNNPNARFELASLAEQLGLIDTAKEEYRNILSLDPESSGALTALRKYADSDLADAREFLNQGQYTLAVQMAQKIPQQYPMYPDLLAQANQLLAQAQVEAQKVAQNSKAEARALAERGDNYYQQAMQYLGAYVSTETDQRRVIFSPRNEAAKYLGQAIFAWKTALQMDPSLGDATTYNLRFKIQDASNKYNAVANRRAPYIPNPRR